MHDVAGVEGTAAPAPPPEARRVIELSPAEFWQLRALVRDVEALELEFVRLKEDLTRRAQEAVARRDDTLTALAAKYGFPPERRYQFHDATCSLHEA